MEPSGRYMPVAFASKLRVAASALGCNSRKDICARFRAANPATQCDLDRLNKWVQGRSLPRASTIYADLATVIGSPRPGKWIAECSLQAFTAELAERTGVDPNILAAVAPASEARVWPSGSAPFGGLEALAGAYASYSPAWSPHFHGQMIRGTLRLAYERRFSLQATYSETLLGGDVRLTGTAQMGRHSLHLTLRDPRVQDTMSITLHVPGQPASVFCGVMSGVAFTAHEALPSVCRVVFVRVPDTPRLDTTNRYMIARPGAIRTDVADLGVDVPDAESFDALTRRFLGSCLDQVTIVDQTAFAALLDPVHLAGACAEVPNQGYAGAAPARDPTPAAVLRLMS